MTEVGSDAELSSAPPVGNGAQPRLMNIRRQSLSDMSHVVEVTGKNVLTGVAGYPRLTSLHETGVAHAEDLIAFGEVEHFAFEGDGGVEITIVRRGTGERAVTVEWWTENLSVPLNSYLEQAATVTIQPGEMKATFTLKLLDNPQWNNEAYQIVRLRPAASSKVNVLVGELSMTTVVTVNDDVFPQGVADSNDGPALIKGFVRHNYMRLKAETRWGLLYKIYPMVFFVVNQLCIEHVIVIIADCLGDCKRHDFGQLDTWAVVFVLNSVMNEVCMMLFLRLKLASKARTAMRTAIMETVVEISPEIMGLFPAGQIQAVMNSEVEAALATIWDATFELFSAVVLILGSTVLALYIAWVDTTKVVGIFITIVPVIIILYNMALLWKYLPKFTKLSSDALTSGDEWRGYILEAMHRKSVIMTYRMGTTTASEFGELHNAATVIENEEMMFQQYFLGITKLFPTLVASALLALGGRQVMFDRGGLTLGTFVAAFNIITAFGEMVSSVFGVLFNMGEGHAAIIKIGEVLNANTRHSAILKSSGARQQLIADFDARHPGRGQDNLVLHDLGYQFPGECERAFPTLGLEVEPSQMVALTASPAFGKSTLLRVIAGQLVPSKGFVIFPPNWRVRFSDGIGQMADNTLMYNLRYGNKHEHTDDEIWALCAQVGLSQYLIGDGEMQVGHEGERLASSDRIYISLIRALLSSVDLLLLANVLDALGEVDALRVMDVLHEMIRQRGLPCLDMEYSATPRDLKKQKLVIISTKLPAVAKKADSIIHMYSSFDGGAASTNNSDISGEARGEAAIEPSQAGLELAFCNS